MGRRGGAAERDPRPADLVAAGSAPTDVIAALTAGERDVAHRQVGLVDARGRAATFTGDACDSWAGGAAGPHYACQGNRLTGPGVVDDMTAAFEGTAGDLDVRLLAALVAGDAAGGRLAGRLARLPAEQLRVRRRLCHVHGTITAAHEAPLNPSKAWFWQARRTGGSLSRGSGAAGRPWAMPPFTPVAALPPRCRDGRRLR